MSPRPAPQRHYTRYTAPFVRRALAQVAAGEPVTTVAARLGMPQSTLSDWCAKANVQPPKRYPLPVVRLALDMVVQGASITSVGNRLGIPNTTLMRYCRKAQIRSQHAPRGRHARVAA